MDEFEFSKYHNFHCMFTFRDGSNVSGVAFLYSFDEKPATKYYFVRTNNLLEFRDADLIGDKKRCKELASEFDLNLLQKAQRLN